MKAKSFNLRVFDAVINCDGVRFNQGRVICAVKRLQALESVLYCDSDLRGLSKPGFCCNHLAPIWIYE